MLAAALEQRMFGLRLPFADPQLFLDPLDAGLHDTEGVEDQVVLDCPQVAGRSPAPCIRISNSVVLPEPGRPRMPTRFTGWNTSPDTKAPAGTAFLRAQRANGAI